MRMSQQYYVPEFTEMYMHPRLAIMALLSLKAAASVKLSSYGWASVLEEVCVAEEQFPRH